MAMRTRSSENQGRIDFRARKCRRSVPVNLKKIDCLVKDGSRSEAYIRPTFVGHEDVTLLKESPLRDSSPLKSRSSGSKTIHSNLVNPAISGTLSPRKRLFQDDISCKENVDGEVIIDGACNYGSPMKQKKIEMDMESAEMRKKNSSLGLCRQDGKQYALIRQQLHTSVPERMLCRERETSIISDFMDRSLKGCTNGSLYVSGAPGTGKTVCLNKVLQKLRDKNLKFKEVWVNCMSLNQSTNIYQKIASQISKEVPSCRDSEKFLEKIFQSKGCKIVLVLDEIDQLESKNQEILYKLFEWPSLPNSRLILVGIANALDLTDRILPRLQAKVKCLPELLQFSPYNKDQIIEILQERLKDVNEGLVDKNTIQFCARKVASVAGDMRKALDIMRRSVELVEVATKRQKILASVTNSPTKEGACRTPVIQKVTLSHVAKVVAEVYSSSLSSHSGGKDSLPLQQKILICTLILLLKNEKSKQIDLPKFHATYTAVCQKRQLSSVGQEEFSSICQLVEARGIITLKQGKNLRLTKVSLRLQESDVEHALQDTTLLSSILEGGIAR